MKPTKKGLYAITDAAIDSATMMAKTKAILEAGAQLLQYRFTQTNNSYRDTETTQLIKLCKQFNVPLLINNDIDLALRINADGVHLGKDDATIAEAREILGNQAIIGCSCYNDLSRARAAIDASADYLAFGTFFPSTTKPTATFANPNIIRLAKRTFTDAFVVAIGGITPENGQPLIDAGADMLAVISGLYQSKTPFNTATKYINLFNKNANLNHK